MHEHGHRGPDKEEERASQGDSDLSVELDSGLNFRS